MDPNKWNKRSVIDFLREQQGKMTSDMIKDILEDAKPRAAKMKKMYLQYRQSKEALAIYGKSAIGGDTNPNNLIPHDFWGEIVDQKTGFSFGNATNYSITREFPEEISEAELKKQKKQVVDLQNSLDEFIEENGIRELDTTTARYQSICGTAGRILYIGKENKNVRVAHVNPWECIWIYDQSRIKLLYGIRYYNLVSVVDGMAKGSRTRVEWYDAKNIYYFVETDSGNYVADPELPSQAHGFNHVPLIEFQNKETRLGDFEKVENLINAYDFINSFNQDELEEFRAAYLKFKGQEVTQEIVDDIKSLGAMSLPEGADAEWLTKVLDVAFNDSHLNRLEQNIYKFSKSVDMSAENFSGGVQSGESRKWKMKAMADDAVLKEAAFEGSLKWQFKVMSDVWNILKMGFENKMLTIKFVQNLPMDLLYHADVTTKLNGLISEQTRLSLLPFIDNVDEEMARMEAERDDIFEDPEINPFDEEMED